MESEANTKIVSISIDPSESIHNINNATDQCKIMRDSDDIPAVDPHMKMLENDSIGYSVLPGEVVLHSQPAYSKSNNLESPIGVSSANKSASVPNSDNPKVTSDPNSFVDPSKRKRMHHDYKKLSKSGYVDDKNKWCSQSSLKQSDTTSNIHRPVMPNSINDYNYPDQEVKSSQDHKKVIKIIKINKVHKERDKEKPRETPLDSAHKELTMESQPSPHHSDDTKAKSNSSSIVHQIWVSSDAGECIRSYGSIASSSDNTENQIKRKGSFGVQEKLNEIIEKSNQYKVNASESKNKANGNKVKPNEVKNKFNDGNEMPIGNRAKPNESRDKYNATRYKQNESRNTLDENRDRTSECRERLKEIKNKPKVLPTITKCKTVISSNLSQAKRYKQSNDQGAKIVRRIIIKMTTESQPSPRHSDDTKTKSNSSSVVHQIWVSSDGGECIRSYDSIASSSDSTEKQSEMKGNFGVKEKLNESKEMSNQYKGNASESKDKVNVNNVKPIELKNKFNDANEMPIENRAKPNDSKDKQNESRDTIDENRDRTNECRERQNESRERLKEIKNKPKVLPVITKCKPVSSNSSREKKNFTPAKELKGDGAKVVEKIIIKMVKERSVSISEKQPFNPKSEFTSETIVTKPIPEKSNIVVKIPKLPCESSTTEKDAKSDLVQTVIPCAFESDLMQIYSSVRALKEAERPVTNTVNGTREEKDVKLQCSEPLLSNSPSQPRHSESSGRSEKHHSSRSKSESSHRSKHHERDHRHDKDHNSKSRSHKDSSHKYTCTRCHKRSKIKRASIGVQCRRDKTFEKFVSKFGKPEGTMPRPVPLSQNKGEPLKYGHFIRVETYPNGGASVVHLYQDEIQSLSPIEMDELVAEYFKIVFGEDSNGNAHHVMGIVHDAARYLPDLLDYMAEHYPSLTVKNGVLGRSSDIETTTMSQYKDQTFRHYANGTVRHGPLHQISLVGTVHEEVGGFFPDLLARLEANPFLKQWSPVILHTDVTQALHVAPSQHTAVVAGVNCLITEIQA